MSPISPIHQHKLKITTFKATTSIHGNGVSSLSKLFNTPHPSTISKDSVMAEEDLARLREFLHGKCKSELWKLLNFLWQYDCCP
ncbi:hypothetical protein Ddye_011448 [Dipteronia dyeriana]|uniref:Uncharacterized protein n=1 Tax=Dipteronia dyeriana TaxID=168575 RepID=A0AAD9X2K0_9ROSI|nr:hypothetical protein Ddye_011448 [Dipteronia dyeriana]